MAWLTHCMDQKMACMDAYRSERLKRTVLNILFALCRSALHPIVRSSKPSALSCEGTVVSHTPGIRNTENTMHCPDLSCWFTVMRLCCPRRDMAVPLPVCMCCTRYRYACHALGSLDVHTVEVGGGAGGTGEAPTPCVVPGTVPCAPCARAAPVRAKDMPQHTPQSAGICMREGFAHVWGKKGASSTAMD